MTRNEFKTLCSITENDMLNCKCSVYFPHIHEFCLFDSVYRYLESDVFKDFEIFEVSIQKCLFNDDSFVTIWLKV